MNAITSQAAAPMTPRFNHVKLAGPAIQAMLKVENVLHDCGLEHSLLLLVKMRASQINGCAFCLDMHSKDARKNGESEARLYLLNAWHESPLYSPRERAALAWTDALTLIADTHAPDAVYEELQRQFSEAEIANLTVLIAQINAWNRIAISARSVHPV
jgi:AhpD family alkylhydroperoxidase